MSPDNGSGSSFSTGAIVGVVIGGVLLVALVVTVIIILRRRRKKRAQGASPPDVYQADTKRPQAGFPAVSYVSEMHPASNVSEMAAASSYSELPTAQSNRDQHSRNTRSHPAELDATTTP